MSACCARIRNLQVPYPLALHSLQSSGLGKFGDKRGLRDNRQNTVPLTPLVLRFSKPTLTKLLTAFSLQRGVAKETSFDIPGGAADRLQPVVKL